MFIPPSLIQLFDEYELVRKNISSFFKIFIYLFLAALGLRCCVRAFFSCSEWGLLLVVVLGLLIAEASFVTECGL